MDSLGQDKRSFYVFGQGFGHHGVVDAPTLIIGTSIGTVAPPAIVVRVFVEMTERISKALFDKSI